MNNRAITLSLLLGVFAVFMVQSYVASIEEQTKKKFGTEVLVVSAKKDIPEMETIDETMLELKKVPKRFLEPTAIYFQESEDDKDAQKGLKDLAGSVAVVPIKTGNQITFNVIREPNIRTGLAPEVAPGKRAIAIPVTEVSGVSKLVKPGDRVDVIAILDVGGSKDSRLARTVLQDIGVLAVGKFVTNNIPRTFEKQVMGDKMRAKSLAEYDGFTSVTLEVSPLQAQMLTLVLSSSDRALFLSLRNNDDSEQVALDGVNIWDVAGPDGVRMRTPASGGYQR